MNSVIGSGTLAGAIAEALGAGSPGVDIPVTDHWVSPEPGDSRPRLPVHTELGRVVIGPAEVPGTPGCGKCARIRSRRARETQKQRDAVFAVHGEAIASGPSAWLTGCGAALVAALVVAEAAALSAGAEAATTCAIVVVDLATLAVSRHSFLPEPLCPQCGGLPDDTAEAAVISLTPQEKLAPDVPRVRAVTAELEALTDLYVDAESGLIRVLKHGTQGGLTVAGAMMPIRVHNAIEPGIGRTRSYRDSKLTALLEALERYGGVSPGGKRTMVTAPFRNVADSALDPRTLGLHPAESYRLPGFAYRPFGKDEPCRWVWGYSFARGEPVLVPENYVYYYAHHENDDQPFAFEISNGCALGSSLAEAVLHGLLEAVERDAFLLTWYARLPVPRIDLASASDRSLPMQAAAITEETGYRVSCFDTTVEHGIPSVWAMAVAGSDDPALPRTVCAAGAHLTLERAAMNSLSELGPLLADFVERYPGERERAEAMVGDPDKVVTMHDHSTLYGAPGAFGRLDFLTGRPGARSFAELGASRPEAFRGTDLTGDLRDMVSRIEAAGMDVVVVDQTTDEHRAGGFACVKVLVPGAAPMTFGHANRRLEGLPRLTGISKTLGYRERPLSPGELNPHPHPFP